MGLFAFIFLTLLFEAFTVPAVEQRPLKTTAPAPIAAADSNTDSSDNDLNTSDTYGFAYYPQYGYYSNNYDNPVTNAFGQGTIIIATPIASPNPANNAHFLAQSIYNTRWNGVPYEMPSTRVRSQPRYEQNNLNKFGGTYDKRPTFDKNPIMAAGSYTLNDLYQQYGRRYPGQAYAS